MRLKLLDVCCGGLVRVRLRHMVRLRLRARARKG